jgi:hypothetical protein
MKIEHINIFLFLCYLLDSFIKICRSGKNLGQEMVKELGHFFQWKIIYIVKIIFFRLQNRNFFFPGKSFQKLFKFLLNKVFWSKRRWKWVYSRWLLHWQRRLKFYISQVMCIHSPLIITWFLIQQVSNAKSNPGVFK